MRFFGASLYFYFQKLIVLLLVSKNIMTRYTTIKYTCRPQKVVSSCFIDMQGVGLMVRRACLHKAQFFLSPPTQVRTVYHRKVTTDSPC